MNVDWVIPCRYVEVHDNLGTLVGAGIDTFWVPELPAPLQLVCAIRLTATADELGSDHQHHSRTVVTGPDGEVVAAAQLDEQISRHRHVIGDDRGGQLPAGAHRRRDEQEHRSARDRRHARQRRRLAVRVGPGRLGVIALRADRCGEVAARR